MVARLDEFDFSIIELHGISSNRAANPFQVIIPAVLPGILPPSHVGNAVSRRLCHYLLCIRSRLNNVAPVRLFHGPIRNFTGYQCPVPGIDSGNHDHRVRAQEFPEKHSCIEINAREAAMGCFPALNGSVRSVIYGYYSKRRHKRHEKNHTRFCFACRGSTAAFCVRLDRLQERPENVYLYNWTYYTPDSVIKQFEEEFGVKVVYDDYASNEDMYAKLKAGGSGYDIVIPSGDYVSIMMSQGMLLPVDLAKIPNSKYIRPEALAKATYDPAMQYSIPYYWGAAGVAVNREKVPNSRKAGISSPARTWPVA